MIKETWTTILFFFLCCFFLCTLYCQISASSNATSNASNYFLFMIFFSYVPIHRVATTILATYHASKYFLVLMFFLMSQFTAKLLLSAFPHIMHPNIFCSYVLFWCANSSPNYSCKHVHISCIKICSCSHVFFLMCQFITELLLPAFPHVMH